MGSDRHREFQARCRRDLTRDVIFRSNARCWGLAMIY